MYSSSNQFRPPLRYEHGGRNCLEELYTKTRVSQPLAFQLCDVMALVVNCLFRYADKHQTVRKVILNFLLEVFLLPAIWATTKDAVRRRAYTWWRRGPSGSKGSSSPCPLFVGTRLECRPGLFPPFSTHMASERFFP